MGESRPETHGPEHPSHKPKPVILILIGVVGGGALFFGVMAWYFMRVDPGGGPSGLKGNATKSSLPSAEWTPFLPNAAKGNKDATHSSAPDKDNGALALEKDALEIVPFSELHVKIVSGIAENVETPKDSGLTATLERNSVKISAAKDARPGSHQVTIRNAKGRQATLNVNVK
ncbi:MAG: hypothetical protein ACLQNE_03315 [Thermoguttaceae bacterium]